MKSKTLNVFSKLIGFAFLSSTIIGVGCFINSKNSFAVTGINQQINFQGRLLNSQGATATDGYYNIEFKIYQDGDGQSLNNSTGSPSGTLKWTEAHLNSAGKGVQVKNGYLSVQLGSVNPFGNSIDWNQDTIWLSMNIANTDQVCAPFSNCSPDGEMLPMKRLSSTPFSLNSGLLGGLRNSQFVQLAQGVQTEAGTNTNSIFINKTGTGNFLNLQANSVTAFTLSDSGDISFGSNNNHSISIANSAEGLTGKSMTINAGAAGSGTSSLNGGNLALQGGNGGGLNGDGGNVIIDAGLKNGSGDNGDIAIGTIAAKNIQIGNNNLSSGSQDINIGDNNTLGGSTNINIGSGDLSTAGTTNIQAKDDLNLNGGSINLNSKNSLSISGNNDVNLNSVAGNISIGSGGNTIISTDSAIRATFDLANNLYLGNGVTATTPSSFAINGTASTTNAVTGGAITVQGGNATIGNANGGNLILNGGTSAGTGANGLVVIGTPTFSTTANDPNCYANGNLVANSCTISSSSVNNSAAILVGFNSPTKSATLPDPTISTAGRVIYVTAANNSQDFSLIVNGGGTGNSIAMRQNTTATMIWNGSDWTAAGASSSTTLQSAYDNTMQSAGGAELIVSRTSTTDGLTIRDSSVNPVNGTLLTVQSASAAGLFSVNSNVTEYSSDSGAETAGTSSSTFPANTWGAINGSTVSRYTTAGNYIATGQGSVSVATSASSQSGVKNTLNTPLTANTNYNVSFTSRLLSGTFTDMNVYYSIDGVNASVECINSKATNTSVWTKFNCTFTAPASGINSLNAIMIRQSSSGVSRTFYIDNLSVTIAADYNYASDGSVNDITNFNTNWSPVSTANVSRSTSVGNDASDSAQVITTGPNQGIRNRLSIKPLIETLYRVTVYSSSSTSGFNNLTIRYSRNGGSDFVNCADYNTQTVSGSTSDFTKITCYITTDSTSPADPYLYFTQTDSASRTFYIDTLSMTLSTNSVPNVQIGGGVNGGPVTLLTLDRGASAPIASDNDALLGSMYYDTTLGKLQCYEADGWGACGSSPDNVVTISPEYTNAVLHGTGIGTMTSDLCSDTLNINDGSSGQPTICGENETFNFYKWTSPQASAQTYGVYVTYQLPSTFKEFASGQTSLMARTDSSNADIQYQIFRNDSTSGLTSCGSAITVSSGYKSSWQTVSATGAADPSTCGFAAGNSVVFKITATTSQNANAYIGNLNFIFSNR